MAGRHSADSTPNSRALPAFLVVLAAMLIAVGGFVFSGNASKSDEAADACSGSVPVRLAAAPEMVPVMEEATKALEKNGADVEGTCIDFEVESSAPNAVATGLGAEPEKAPHLWVPDSGVWVTRVAQQGANPAVLAQSLGSSPVVVVGPEGEQPSSWKEVGMNTVAFLDPLTSSASTAALLSAFQELEVTGATENEMGEMMVPLAQRYGAQPNKPKTVEEVAEAASEGSGVMTEQQLVSLQNDGKAEDLKASVPKVGTMVLDYPLAALSAESFAREAGSQVAVFMAGPAGKELLAEHGFRGTDHEPLETGQGLGKASMAALPTPDANAVSGALRQWAVLTVPSRMLTVVDVSGSMDFTDAGQPRIDLAITAAQGALQLFPDNAQIGIWAFSVGLGGGNQDYRELVPIRPLSGSVRGGSQRDALGGALQELPSMTGGGTGLYDSTLAAIRTLQANYDARAINSVILLTDGENEDPGSISLKDLIGAIERERDPARPIQVIAIGMGPEADEKALKRIAGATGGRAYVARDPADISEVFIDAMLAR